MSEAPTYCWVVYCDEGTSACAEERVWSVHLSKAAADVEAVEAEKEASYGSRVERRRLWP
jgi:hypothetical protein